MKYLFLLLTFIYSSPLLAQIRNLEKVTNNSSLDTTAINNNSNKNKPGFNIKDVNINDYKIFSNDGSFVSVDTSLTIDKEYKFNYLRKDNFGLIPFANIGQTYNSLTRDFKSHNHLPLFGARARHYGYFEVDDIRYYEVPTPFTELFYKTAFQQGQLLDAFFTVNTTKQFNFSLAYKGMRSLGNYQNALTSTGNLRFTTNYTSKNERFTAKTHIVTQDLMNQENGGLTDADVANFISGDEDFIDRSVFDPNFDDAENILVGKRFYSNLKYSLLPKSDSINNKLVIKGIIKFEDKYYEYNQTSTSSFFGNSFSQSNIKERVTLENFETELLANYQTPVLGNVSLGIRYNDVNYGYDKITLIGNDQIPNRIKDRILSVNGQYMKKIDNFTLNSKIASNVIGSFASNSFRTDVEYNFKEDHYFRAGVNFSSNAPNYNYLLYQSDYINYNWNNIESFNNQKIANYQLDFKSDMLFDLSIIYSNIKNYTFFASENTTNFVKPMQSNQVVNHFKVKLDKEFTVGSFALDNTILFQKVKDESQALNLPELVLRNTIYYSNHFFKNNALFLQTGVTLNYFSEYYMDGYDPLLAEFYSQNEIKLGGYPRLDFFINAKIRQTRIFFKAEHFNSAFTGYNYFAAPNTPYRDFTVRFGLVWDFFL
nr:putative porin [uncultured Psychroserpens sp.]